MGIFSSLDSIDDIGSTPIGAKFIIVEYTYDSFLEKIQDLSLTNTQIQNKIVHSYESYMDYDNFKNPNTREVFTKLWTNERFLNNVFYVLDNNMIKLDRLNEICVNKLAYDYYASKDKNSTIEGLLLKIAARVNYSLIVQLCTIMDYNSAMFISMSTRASFDPIFRVNILNEFIIKLRHDFSVKDIIYIYSKTYDEDFSTLFIYTMTGDGIVDPSNYNTPERREKYDRISYVLLLILESMPTSEIRKVLNRYGNYISLTNQSKVRFSLKNLSGDFKRVSANVMDVEMIEGINIP